MKDITEIVLRKVIARGIERNMAVHEQMLSLFPKNVHSTELALAAFCFNENCKATLLTCETNVRTLP